MLLLMQEQKAASVFDELFCAQTFPVRSAHVRVMCPCVRPWIFQFLPMTAINFLLAAPLQAEKMKSMRCCYLAATTLVALCPVASSFVAPSRIERPRPPSINFDGRIITKPPTSHQTRQSKTSLSMISALTSRATALHGNISFVLSAILLISTAGIQLEKNTLIGKALSAPLATMALSLTVANLGVVPFSSPVCK